MNVFAFISSESDRLKEVCLDQQLLAGGDLYARTKAVESMPDWGLRRRRSLDADRSHPLWDYYESFVGFPLCWLRRENGRWINQYDLLTIKRLADCVSSQRTCALSPGWSSKWGAIDIDVSSPYHPRQAGWKYLDKMQSLLADSGATALWTVQSSYSGGLHLWFPVKEEVSSDKLSVFLSAVIIAADLVIAPGVAEIFPSVRQSEVSDHNHIRLPLIRSDSMILGSTVCSPSNVRGIHDFAAEWRRSRLDLDSLFASNVTAIDSDSLIFPGKSLICGLAANGEWK